MRFCGLQVLILAAVGFQIQLSITIEPSIMKAAVAEYMKTVQSNVLKGFRVPVGEQFIPLYPKLNASVKDTKDKQAGEITVATAKMLTANKGRRRGHLAALCPHPRPNTLCDDSEAAQGVILTFGLTPPCKAKLMQASLCACFVDFPFGRRAKPSSFFLIYIKKEGAITLYMKINS